MQVDNEDGGRSRQLRRWGPIAAILVAVAVVAAVLVSGGGGDDDDVVADDDGPAEAPAGAISFSRGQDENLDVTFPDTCDEETGEVAVPYFFAPECYADVDDNGGATATGVTADTIKIAVYIPPDNDPILDFITGPAAVDDTADEIKATYQGYVDLFNATYQTYGRTVELAFVDGSGNANDEVAARADAVKAADMQPFAVWGAPALTDVWTEELAAREIVTLTFVSAQPSWMQERAPYVYAVTANPDQSQRHLVEWLSKQVAGRPAEHAGSALATEDRVFAHLWLETDADSRVSAENLDAKLAEAGIELAASLPYSLDPARLQEQATAVVARLKDAGVTSVIFRGDPVAPATFTPEATSQQYFPEWILGGSALIDTAAFGRTYDQEQWQHAFGISTLGARTTRDASSQYRLYEWFHGEPPPADDQAGVIFPHPASFFSALQAAGPDLTPQTFRNGLFAGDPTPNVITQPSISYGEEGLWPYTDWNGIDDATELWWDPEATGEDEVGRDGTGMYRYVDRGLRYLPGSWPERDSRAFDPADTITIYEELPPEERPPDYPSPGG